MSRITVVTSGKGGAGKSTVSAGLGYALAKAGASVLLVDGDAGLRGLDLMLGIGQDMVFDL
ncbi:MAG: P-loop NTPase, partial [Clostridia bacterium]|nr:P-loop NTPase [Clostridia bacterium]